MDHKTQPYEVTNEGGEVIQCDAVIENSSGEWAAIWYSDGADHVTYDEQEYIEAPDNWRDMVIATD